MTGDARVEEIRQRAIGQYESGVLAVEDIATLCHIADELRAALELAEAKAAVLVGALDNLQKSEQACRRLLEERGSRTTDEAWAAVRRAGDAAREALAAIDSPTKTEG